METDEDRKRLFGMLIRYAVVERERTNDTLKKRATWGRECNNDADCAQYLNIGGALVPKEPALTCNACTRVCARSAEGEPCETHNDCIFYCNKKNTDPFCGGLCTNKEDVPFVPQ